MANSQSSFAFGAPFLTSCYSVLSAVLGEVPEKVLSGPDSDSTPQVNVVVAVVGKAEGHVAFGMSQEAAIGIATAMMGFAVSEMDELAQSAIAELCNMICGSALSRIHEAGFTCDLAPPTIVLGNRLEIRGLHQSPTSLSLLISHGTINISVALHAANDNRAIA